MLEPDVIVYPDSSKIDFLAVVASGVTWEKRLLSQFFETDTAVYYWEKEE